MNCLDDGLNYLEQPLQIHTSKSSFTWFVLTTIYLSNTKSLFLRNEGKKFFLVAPLNDSDWLSLHCSWSKSLQAPFPFAYQLTVYRMWVNWWIVEFFCVYWWFFSAEWTGKCIWNGNSCSSFAVFIFRNIYVDVSCKRNYHPKWSAIVLSVRIELDRSIRIYKEMRNNSVRNDQETTAAGSFDLPDESGNVYICESWKENYSLLFNWDDFFCVTLQILNGAYSMFNILKNF